MGNIDGPRISGESLDYKNNKLLACSYQGLDPIEIYDLAKREKISSPKIKGSSGVF